MTIDLTRLSSPAALPPPVAPPAAREAPAAHPTGGRHAEVASPQRRRPRRSQNMVAALAAVAVAVVSSGVGLLVLELVSTRSERAEQGDDLRAAERRLDEQAARLERQEDDLAELDSSLAESRAALAESQAALTAAELAAEEAADDDARERASLAAELTLLRADLNRARREAEVAATPAYEYDHRYGNDRYNDGKVDAFEFTTLVDNFAAAEIAFPLTVEAAQAHLDVVCAATEPFEIVEAAQALAESASINRFDAEVVTGGIAASGCFDILAELGF